MHGINQIEPWMGEEEKQQLAEVIDSGWFTEAGKTREFEKVFAEFVDSTYAVAICNGTMSLTVACMAFDIGEGDEVIVPDFTMIASANAVKLAGAEPVLVDIDEETLCIDLEALEAAITERTKAVMPVALNGRYPNMVGLMRIAQNHDLFVLEDAAQALGSYYHGKHLGTLGDIGSFSFSTPKVISTGQGGMLVTDDEELYQRIVRIKDFGRRTHGEDFHVTMGFNFKFSDFQAAVGVAQMQKLPWRLERKKEMFTLYQDRLADVDGLTFVETNLEDTSPWFIDVLVEDGRRDLLASFLKERGIGTRPFYPAIHTQAPYSHVVGEYPNSVSISERGLWLPSSTFLSDEVLETVCNEIQEYFQTVPVMSR
jgi:perosamine synthetase